MKTILEIKNLNLKIKNNNENLEIIKDFNLTLNENESIAIFGKSGAGKTLISKCILKLLKENMEVSGEIIYDNINLLSLSEKEINKYRGREIAMIFQEAQSALNPSLKIGSQITEVLTEHFNMKYTEAKKKSLEMLMNVGIDEAEKRFHQYPHQLSGGMKQRVLIAISLITNPKILICDEITTSLDVKTQENILNLILKLKKELRLSLIIISHDMYVVNKMADKVIYL